MSLNIIIKYFCQHFQNILTMLIKLSTYINNRFILNNQINQKKIKGFKLFLNNIYKNYISEMFYQIYIILKLIFKLSQ